MNSTRKITIAATMALALAWSLAGCSFLPTTNGHSGGSTEQSQSPADHGDALERYAEAERSQLPAVMDANPGVFSDIQVDAEAPSTVSFTYTYASFMDAAATSSNLDGLVDSLQDACDSSVFPAMTQTGVEGPLHVEYTYLNNDGTQIWTHTFDES